MPERLTVTPRQFFPCLVSPEPLEVVSLSQTAAPFAGFLWTGTGGGGRDAWSADDWAAQLGQADIANYVVYAAGEPVGCFELEVMPGEGVRLNHLGVETFEQADVDRAIERLGAAGIKEKEEQEETCCFATQNKVWSRDPQGMRWEWYRILADAEQFGVGDADAGAAQETGATPTSCCPSGD